MFFRIPDEFLIDVKKVSDLNLVSSEYRSEDIEKDIFEEKEDNLFEEADEEYLNESIDE